jgi:hypothetical protein
LSLELPAIDGPQVVIGQAKLTDQMMTRISSNEPESASGLIGKALQFRVFTIRSDRDPTIKDSLDSNGLLVKFDGFRKGFLRYGRRNKR